MPKNKALEKSKPQTVTTINAATLQNGFPDRLNGLFHEFSATPARETCQFCSYKLKRDYPKVYGKEAGDAKKRAPATTKDVLKCLVCNVRLCVHCFHEFHGHM